MSIRTRATLIGALFLIVASVALSFLSYRSQRSHLIAESRRKIEVALSLLSEMSARPLEQGDTLTLARIADRAARGEPERVSTADRTGLILADSSHSGYDTTNEVIQSAMRSLRPMITRSEGHWQAATPVIDASGRLTGVVYVTFSTEPLDAALDQAALTVASFAMLSIILAGLVGYAFGRYLTASFTPLLAGIRRTAAGDLQSRVQPVGVSELDEISVAFNRMSRLVASRVHKLETLNQMAVRLAASRTVEEFVESLGTVCETFFNGSCNLLLGDPRTGVVRLVGGDRPMRHVTSACLANTVVTHQRTMTIGKKGDREPGTQVVEGFGPQSAVVAPLVTRENEAVGVLSVDFSPRAMPTPGREVAASIEAISILIAPMLAAIQRIQTQERAVAALREILLPESPVQPEGVEVFAEYEMAEKSSGFGGDYYDVLRLGDDVWGFAIGDVSGKGLEAGRYTAMAKYAVRSFALQYGGPAETISHANAVLTSQMSETMFLTLFLGMIDVNTSRMVYSCAGHLPAMRYSSREGSVQDLGVGGMAVGIQENAAYNEAEVELEPGDTLLLYTDGLIEARRGIEQYGFDRLRQTFGNSAHRELKEIASVILDDLRDFTQDGPQDDLAMMLLRIREGERVMSDE